MKGNNKSLKHALIAVILTSTFSVFSQRQQELVNWDVDSTETNQHTWRCAADVSLIAAGFVGNMEGGHLGLMVDRSWGKWGLRFGAKFRPERSYINNMAVDISDTQIQYLDTYFRGWTSQASVGITRSREARFGLVYLAGDLTFAYGQQTYDLVNVWRDLPLNQTGIFSNSPTGAGLPNLVQASRTLHRYGPGVTGAIGYALFAGKRFGIDSELQANLNLITGESVQLNDNATFTNTGMITYINFEPRISFRLHYRL